LRKKIEQTRPIQLHGYGFSKRTKLITKLFIDSETYDLRAPRKERVQHFVFPSHFSTVLYSTEFSLTSSNARSLLPKEFCLQMNPITEILQKLEKGDSQAAEDLLPKLYDELRQLAASKLANESPGQTLQPTALVHEAWLRLGGEGQNWQNRAHFFAAAAEAMRRILIENARRKRAIRHGGGQQRLDIHEMDIPGAVEDDELLEVHEALDQFAAQDGRKAELVKLRFFVGLTIEETAEVMGISVPTAKRWWNYGRAWLRAEIDKHRTT
jgi:RNA polymerase sigma factor (TIGR02999 family)